ncbi:carboxypeptidase-like regulatory domain-containing protein [bacterium]|nr:carboxypeptidase-like regulatory domain-containing protein [bacterium]
MKIGKILIHSLLAFLLIAQNIAFASISGNVKKEEINGKNQIVDSKTGQGIDRARVSIPTENFRTLTDPDGTFEITKPIEKKSILSVEKEGYRPFSITIDKNSLQSPIKIGIEETKAGDITLENSLCHLGDNMYSSTSANSFEFQAQSVGTFWTKSFKLEKAKTGERKVLIIGSVIGLDTKEAKDLGQNNVAKAYSSPTEIFFNGQKIGELKINGDNQIIGIPNRLIMANNEITIKTGKNLFQRNYVDYDDIEIINVRIETR